MALKLPIAAPYAIDEAAIADARAIDLMEHYTRRVAERVAAGETVAVTIGGEVHRIFGNQLPGGSVGPGDPLFDVIVANTNAAAQR